MSLRRASVLAMYCAGGAMLVAASALDPMHAWCVELLTVAAWIYTVEVRR